MLVLTAYDGEKIHIGDDVVLVIDRCIDDGEATRLGIDAPKEVKVLREELFTPKQTNLGKSLC